MLIAGFLRFSLSCSEVKGLGREGDLAGAEGVEIFAVLKLRS